MVTRERKDFLCTSTSTRVASRASRSSSSPSPWSSSAFSSPWRPRPGATTRRAQEAQRCRSGGRLRAAQRADAGDGGGDDYRVDVNPATRTLTVRRAPASCSNTVRLEGATVARHRRGFHEHRGASDRAPTSTPRGTASPGRIVIATPGRDRDAHDHRGRTDRPCLDDLSPPPLARLRRSADDEGFSIVEVMVAMLIFAVFAVASLGFVMTSLSATALPHRHGVAKNLDQELLESMRNLPFHIARDRLRPRPDLLDTYYTSTSTPAASTAADRLRRGGRRAGRRQGRPGDRRRSSAASSPGASPATRGSPGA